MASCPQCGREVDGKSCPACGAKIPAKDEDRAETLLYGSPVTDPPVGETLVLGSNVPLVSPSPRPLPKPPEPPTPAAEPFAPKAKERPPPESDAAPRRPPRRRRPVSLPEARAPEPRAPVQKSKKSVPNRLAIAIAITAVVTAIGLALVIATWRSGPALHGRALFDERGAPLVDIECGECSPQTMVTLNGRSALVQNGHAELPLDSAVSSLGEHPVSVGLEIPGHRRTLVDVPVSVAWTISADLSGLSHPTPVIGIVVDALPAVGVIVDGHSLVAQSGPRRYEINVSTELTGEVSRLTTLTRRVPYVISVPGAAPIRSTLEVTTDIVPLSIEAPGESITIEGSSFMLAGSTQPNGSISVEGRAITVDPSGRFAQLMNVSSVGNTTIIVRASAPGRAPRLAPIRVRRVQSLAEEALRFRARATTTYSALSENTEQKLGWSVALSGKVVEATADGFRAHLVLQVDEKPCSEPCLVSLVLGDKSKFGVGDRISAYGYVAEPGRSAEGRTLPEVRVEFLRGESE